MLVVHFSLKTYNDIDNLVQKRIEQIKYKKKHLTVHEERMLRIQLKGVFERFLYKNEFSFYIKRVKIMCVR